MYKLSVVLALGIVIQQTSAARAGNAAVDLGKNAKEVVLEASPFDRDRHEFQALGGAFFSFTHSPNLNYAIGTLRLGCMLNSPSGSGVFRGNTECLIDIFGGPIWEGPGDGLAGATLLLRYNFVQPQAVIVPYAQIGVGGLYSDAAEDHEQRLIGSHWEFNLQASVGLRWFCTQRCAFTLEGGYRHISNGNLADRNTGVDSLGGMLGVSVFF
jgi:hypothetical protein